MNKLFTNNLKFIISKLNFDNNKNDNNDNKCKNCLFRKKLKYSNICEKCANINYKTHNCGWCILCCEKKLNNKQ